MTTYKSTEQSDTHGPIFLIMLLGGRIQPAAVAAIQTELAAVAVIFSSDTPKTSVQLQKILEGLNPSIPIVSSMISQSVPWP